MCLYLAQTYAIGQYQEAEICKTNSTTVDNDTTIFISNDVEMVLAMKTAKFIAMVN